MTEVNRKIHVIGINSYKFEDLSFKLHNLFLETENIAVPNSYLEEIKSWSEIGLLKRKSFFSSKSNNQLINWLRSQKTDVILISRGDPLWYGIGRILLESFSKDEVNILSNESSQIIRLLNSIKIQSKYQILTIKDCNQKFLDLVNNSINDGVYKCGFARNQSAYEKASQNLFAAINEIENLLQKNKGDWIFGEELTYADIYLFPTLIRWELIYSKLFKCTEQELSSFEKIIEWRLKFFKLSNVNRTCFDNEWKKDYYKALLPLNPNQLIPDLPSLKEIMRLES